MAFNPTVAAKQRSWGLPEEPLYDMKLVFNPASGSILLGCSLLRGRIRFPQVFFRRATDRRYSSVAELAQRTYNWDGDIAIEYPFSCEGPKALCLASRYDLRWSGSAASSSSLGLLAVDLEEGSCDLWDTRDGVVADWIIQAIVGCSGSGGEVYGIVGFPKPTEHGYHVEYFVTRLAWSSRTVEKLYPLPAVHF